MRYEIGFDAGSKPQQSDAHTSTISRMSYSAHLIGQRLLALELCPVLQKTEQTCRVLPFYFIAEAKKKKFHFLILNCFSLF